MAGTVLSARLASTALGLAAGAGPSEVGLVKADALGRDGVFEKPSTRLGCSASTRSRAI